MPVRGPMIARAPTRAAETTLPSTIAARPAQNPRPANATAKVPIANAAGTRLGVNHTVNTRYTAP
jgi:hypothetical protein